MKLLLKRDIPRLGLIGDVVEVSTGYARNYLIPQRLAVEPTPANMKAIEEEKRRAEEERKARRRALERAAAHLKDVDVMISTAANPEGHLYGSVGRREIAAALRDKGHEVEASSIELHESIRQLGNYVVPVVFAEDLRAEVKVWVVREGAAGNLEVESQEQEEEPTDDAASREADEGGRSSAE